MLLLFAFTVNPLLSPPGGLVFASTFEGGGLNGEGGRIQFSESHHLNKP